MGKRRSISSTHLRMEFVRQRGIFQPGIRQSLREVQIVAGEYFGQIQEDRIHMLDDILIGMFSMFERERSSDERAWSLLLAAVFCKNVQRRFGDLQQKLGNPSIDHLRHHLFGSLTNNYLAYACLLMSPTEIAAIRRLKSDATGIGNRTWNIHITGALTVARVSSLFLARGFLVYLPPPFADVIHKVDLVARSPYSNTTVCVQVKTATAIQDLSIRGVLNGLEQVDSKLSAGVARYEEQYKGTFVPLEIVVSERHFVHNECTLTPTSELNEMFPKIVESLTT